MKQEQTATDLVDRLAAHRAVGSAPREELEWLAVHGSVFRFEAGEVITKKSELLTRLYIVLSGRFAFFLDRGSSSRKVKDWVAGDVTGLLPYSRMGKPPGEAVVEEETEVLMIEKEHFPELTRQCPVVTANLVHEMVDRARLFNTTELHDEKMASLGRLAAGLAHELNNPASAAARSAQLLSEGLAEIETTSRALGAAGLSQAQWAMIDTVRGVCLSNPGSVTLSPIQRADREEMIADWLTQHGADTATAAPLTDTAVTIDTLDKLASAFTGPTLDAALRWIASDCSTRMLASEVEKAAQRIQNLVGAVKRFTYMDRHTVPEAVDLTQGLNDTVAVLANKGRAKSVGINIAVEPNLPRVQGFGGELNQVWANLIDNALDAVPPGGHVSVTARRNLGSVVVSVIDDGPGIAPENRVHILEPFFTTKPVGQGTGLGLDIVRRLVLRHQGELEFQSQPGRTEFRVTLPAAEGATEAKA